MTAAGGEHIAPHVPEFAFEATSFWEALVAACGRRDAAGPRDETLARHALLASGGDELRRAALLLVLVLAEAERHGIEVGPAELRAAAAGKYEIVAVSLDENRDEVPRFVREHRLTLPVLLGETAVARAWGVRGLPTSFLVSPEGLIARRWVGNPDLRAVENDIVAVLDRRPS